MADLFEALWEAIEEAAADALYQDVVKPAISTANGIAKSATPEYECGPTIVYLGPASEGDTGGDNQVRAEVRIAAHGKKAAAINARGGRHTGWFDQLVTQIEGLF